MSTSRRPGGSASHKAFYERVCWPRLEQLRTTFVEFRDTITDRFDQHAKTVADRLDRRDTHLAELAEAVDNGWGEKIKALGEQLRDEFRTDMKQVRDIVHALDTRLWLLL